MIYPSAISDKDRQRMEHRAKAMAIVDAVDFRTQPLMNKSEYRQFSAIERRVCDLKAGYRVMAQVSLAEIMRPVSNDERAAKAAIWELNTRRIDFAVIDGAGHLAVAVEYQGHGHYQGGAFARDAIKREVIRKSGAEWMEIEADASPDASANAIVARLRRRGSPRQP
ncbi:DUF2726 domain-containing protein [Anianabacter salinae]|uniref:DUF2726 domain-containing protein n=1 Tax=Anianabacter salinae TaxID=2851023 RepID=UPI00225E481E|nr:DUF2726 domain-containing protein [Anianabacter salinae]MBV0912934.1 DUF2726 domain-containing protein [Anianabacter salinae]